MSNSCQFKRYSYRKFLEPYGPVRRAGLNRGGQEELGIRLAAFEKERETIRDALCIETSHSPEAALSEQRAVCDD